MLDGSDGRDAALLNARQNEDGRKDYLIDALLRGDLHTIVADTELESRLTDLFRASRLAFEEGGANIPGTTNTFGGSSKTAFGDLVFLTYPNTGFVPRTITNDFRRVIPNPCRSSNDR